MSRPAEDRAIVEAGLKALAFDSGPRLVCNEPAATYELASDEHGRGGNIRDDPWPTRHDGQPLRRRRWLTRRTASNRSVEAEDGDPVGLHEPVLRAEDHALQIGLRNDQPVERVVVMARQSSGALCMGAGDWQNLETEL